MIHVPENGTMVALYVVVRASDLWSTGCEFDSWPRTSGL